MTQPKAPTEPANIQDIFWRDAEEVLPGEKQHIKFTTEHLLFGEEEWCGLYAAGTFWAFSENKAFDRDNVIRWIPLPKFPM